ncbi:hypothetical protein ACQSSU_26000 [Micromonospora echinospora]
MNRTTRRLCLFWVVLLTVTLLPGSPAQARPSAPGLPKDRAVPVERLAPKKRGVSPSDRQQWSPQQASLPGAASAVVPVDRTPAAGGEVERTPVGDLPVRLTPDPASSVPAPQQLQVSVTDQSEAQEAGVPVLLRLDRLDDGLTRSRVRIEVDYSGFRAAYGADWASRLRLVRMKPCVGGQAADTTACGVDTVLPSSNDTNPGVVSAALDLATLADAGATSANPGGGEAVADAVLALSAGTDSETGSFAKTSLSESSAWQAGQSSGDFGYSYPLELPAAPSDLAPEVTFGYSSGAVDGRTNAESGQTSWLGEGWNYEPGYIERSYRSCKDDQLPVPTFTNATGDLCWREENATLVWQGRSTELIRDSATATWRLAEDDGSRIELLQNGVDWNDALNVFSPGDFDGDGHADVMLRYASNLNTGG